MTPPLASMSLSMGLLVLLLPVCWCVDTPAWWPRALASLPSVCVLDNTCHQYSKERLDTEYTRHVNSRQTPCCTGCSCHPTCNLDGNCCFPAHYEYPDRSRQECIFPLDHRPRFPHLYKSYYMYVECDPAYLGSVTTDAGESVNHDIELTDTGEFVLGTFEPVYSKTAGRVYYNRIIAECNQANDAIDWQLRVQCNNNLFDYLDLSNVTSLLNSNECRSGFTYPGTPSDLRTEECFDGLTQSCAPVFSIPSGINMTAGEVVEACTSGLFSPFLPHRNEDRHIYANVFCFICDGGSFNYAEGMCPLADIFVARNGLDTKPFTLIFSSQNQLGGSEDKEKTEACSRTQDPHDSPMSCRPVLCPTGQSLLTSGNCGYVFETVEIPQLHIYLKLQVVPGNSLPLLQDIPLNNFNYMSSPWLDANWTILYMYCETAVSDLDSCSIDYMVVVLEKSEASVEPRQFFDDIQIRLKDDWLLEVNGHAVRYSQSLYRHTLFKCHDNTSTTSMYTSPDQSDTRQNISGPDTLYSRKDVAVSDLPIDRSPILTKMFYCPQVELNPNEYVRYLDDNLIRVKATNTVLYSGENTMDNDGTMKICLSDSGLFIMKSSANGIGPGYVILIVYVCIWLIQASIRSDNS